MLTTSQINSAIVTPDGHLQDIDQASLETLIRSSALYQAKLGLYPNLTAKLAEASGFKAKQLSALIDRIELLGDKVSSLKGYAGGIDSSNVVKREALIAYGLSVLYEPPTPRPLSAVMPMQSSVVTLCASCGFNHRLGACPASEILLVQ